MRIYKRSVRFFLHLNERKKFFFLIMLLMGDKLLSGRGAFLSRGGDPFLFLFKRIFIQVLYTSEIFTKNNSVVNVIPVSL